MFQVCEICGDAGFPDLIFICKQCKSAQHFYCSYCMSKQPDSDGEGCWSCESCMLKQETTQGTVVSSSHSEIEQSQKKRSKCQKECRDSHSTIKKQAFEGSNGTDSLNKKQELDNFDVTEALLASKRKAIECSNENDFLPKHKEKTLRSYSGIECLFINKKQQIEGSNGIVSPSNNNKRALGSSSSTDFSQNTEKQVRKNSNGTDYSLTRRKQFVENSGGISSLPSGKKQEPEISNGSKKQEIESSKCISCLASKKQSSKCSNHIDSLLISKKEVVNSSFGTDSPPASEKQTPESLKNTSSLSVSKNKPLGSVNCIDSLSVGKKRVLENTDSLPASKKQSLRSSSVADPLPARKKQETASSNNTDFSKERSENRPSPRELTVFKAQMMPALVASGSKSAMVEKSFDSSCPNALDSAKISLRSSKKIGSESKQSSLNRNSSKSKIAVECIVELKKLVPADSIKSLESNRDGSKSANEVFDKYKSSKMLELSPVEVDAEYSSGLLAKGNSSGYDVVSAGETNNRKEIDQSLIGKSTVEDTITTNERDYEINNRSIERSSISEGTDKRKIDANAVLSNNHYLRCLNEHDKEEIDHSMRKFSEIKVSSPSESEKRSLSSCERDFIAGNMLSYSNCSSGTSLPQQLQLTIPQSLILWKGTFNVDISIGHAIYGGIQAHPSTTASLKVYEMSKQFGSQLYLEQVHRAEAWPRSFEQSPPTDDNVGLYFFPEDGKFEQSFATLVEYINKHDLAMRMHLDGAELLIYSSIQLPKYVQRIFGKFYLWGVFRRAEKSTTGHKLHEASMQHDHVRAVMVDSVAPSRSNMVGIKNVHKNGVKVEMDFEMEAEKDAAVSERPLRRMDSQSARLPPVCISPLALPLDSEVNHFRTLEIKGDDANTSRCALYGQDQSLLGIRSMVKSENSCEVVSRRCSGKHIDWSREQYRSSGIEKVDGQSVSNSLDPHILDGEYSGKTRESMHDRSNERQSHEEMNTGESTSRFVAPNRMPFLEEKDDIELLTLQPQARNIKSGLAPTSCPTDWNSQPSSSNHLREKHGLMHFQVESNANAGAKKQNDLRNQCHVFSTRDQLDGHQKSRQSSLSTGDSDSSYGNNCRSLSQPTSKRKFYEHEEIHKFSRSQSFKDHIGTKTKICKEEDGRKEDTKLVMERYREKSHRLWQTKYGRSHGQIEINRGCKERNLKHWQTEDGRRHGQMEDCRSPIVNYRVNSSNSYSDKGDMLEETSMHRDSLSYLHEKASMHRLSSNNHQSQVNNCLDKDKVYMVDNFKSVEKDFSATQSGEASDQYQVVKDQQSSAPLRTATDETVENNSVSEISNAASTLESPGQIYPEEIVPRLVEPDLPVSVNSRTEHTTTLALDQNPSLSHDNWYASSSPGQADQEPVEYLQLFPLEEENLGATKNIVKELEDINLDLSIGRGSVKNTLKMADGQVRLNRSDLEDPDVNPCLGVSLPLEKEKKHVT